MMYNTEYETVAIDEVLENQMRQNASVFKEYFESLYNDIDENMTSKSAVNHGIKYSDILRRAISGDLQACLVIANMIGDGECFPKDPAKSKEILHHLAFGIPDHVYPNSAYFYARSCLRDSEFDECHMILKSLIDNGFLPAYALMGNIYDYGYGVDRSFSKAHQHYEHASKSGHIFAKFLRAKLFIRYKGFLGFMKGASLILVALIWTVYYYFVLNPENDDLRTVF